MEAIESRRNEVMCEITALRMLLAQTDYKCLKHSDGALTDEEYAETKAQRAAWRAKINELEAELIELDDAAQAMAEAAILAAEEDETDLTAETAESEPQDAEVDIADAEQPDETVTDDEENGETDE